MTCKFLFVTHLRVVATIAVFIFALATMPSGAFGQGLFQSLFGFLGPSSPEAPQVSRSRPKPRTNPFGPTRHEVWSRNGRYRTVCVRMCDGYYFPISHSVSRRDFHRDADMCRSRCAGDARLFYMPSSRARIEEAYDQTGMAYQRIKNAFLYRKKLIQGCACRPAPWSVAERLRHRMYAINAPEARAAQRVAAGQPAVEGGSGEGGSGGDGAAPQLAFAPARAVPVEARAFAAPEPRIAPRPVLRAEPSIVDPTAVRRRKSRRPVEKKNSWGLGANFGSTAAVRYRHKWDPAD